MAHSNRAKKKEARGGLTRNQARKKNSISPEERLKNILEWNRQREEKQFNSDVTLSIKKVKKPTMWRSVQLRRITALKNLELKVKSLKDSPKVPKWQGEIKTLKSRINIAA